MAASSQAHSKPWLLGKFGLKQHLVYARTRSSAGKENGELTAHTDELEEPNDSRADR
jgi:hypothetical protein